MTLLILFDDEDHPLSPQTVGVLSNRPSSLFLMDSETYTVQRGILYTDVVDNVKINRSVIICQ